MSNDDTIAADPVKEPRPVKRIQRRKPAARKAAPADGKATVITKTIGKPQDREHRESWEKTEEEIASYQFSDRKFGPLHGLPREMIINGVLYDTLWACGLNEKREWDHVRLQERRNEGWEFLPIQHAPEALQMLACIPKGHDKKRIVSKDAVAMIRDRRISLREKEVEQRERSRIEAMRMRTAGRIRDDGTAFNIGGGAPQMVDLGASLSSRDAVVDLEVVLREAERQGREQLSSGPPPPERGHVR